MKTPICDLLGIEFPLIAFSHCRDVVAAVTNAGGFGVLGAQLFTPEELDRELTWIAERTAGKPFGADVLIPDNFAGKGEERSGAELAGQVPPEHRAFVQELLARHGIDAAVDHDFLGTVPAVSDGHGEKLLEVIFRHPVGLVANALGVPPDFMIERAHAAGVPVAALVGAREHAVKQVRAGVDVLIAQGTEAGGHTGEISTMVLIPEVIAAIADERPVPVLAAGGIVTGRQMAAAVTLGAAGACTFLTAALGRRLTDAFDSVADSVARCVVLTGTGRAFAAGADIGPLRTGDLDAALRFNRLLIDLAERVAAFPVPVVCCINGMAFGGGLELALACTLRVADPAATMGFPEVKVGIVPGSGGLLRLPAVVSRGMAAQLVLTGRTVDAAEALRLGLVDEIAADPVARGHEIGAAVAAAAPLAVRAALELLRRPALEHAEVEKQLRSLLGTADAAQGFAAFTERRQPRFSAQ